MKRTDIDKTKITEPRLYTIVRSDIADLTPGKLGAQTGHAASKFTARMAMNNHSEDDPASRNAQSDFNEWLGGDRGFGTKITLSATQSEIIALVDLAGRNYDVSGTVVDDSYPFRNYFGKMFTAQELTCGYVFVTANTSKTVLDALRQLPLHE